MNNDAQIHECNRNNTNTFVKYYFTMNQWCLERSNGDVFLMPINYCPFCACRLDIK